MHLPSLDDVGIAPGTRVLLRADFDAGIRHGRIADAWRIERVLPAIRLLLQKKARLRLLAHMGRPGGRRQPAFTLAPVARFLSRALERPVPLVADPFGDGWDRDADIVLFENLRFWPGEEANDPSFAAALARHGGAYVNEAFAVCHRPHASVATLPTLLPACAGPHLTAEVGALEHLFADPARPLIAVFGGAKIETKLPLIRRFLAHADRVLVGGALANAVFALQGHAVGKSVTDAAGVRDLSFVRDPKLVLPSDIMTVPRLASDAGPAVRTIGDVRPDEYIADIGPGSAARFSRLLADAATIVWNGPMGYAEVPAFAGGTIAVAHAMQRSGAFTVVGGGDTLATLGGRGLLHGFSHVSAGGGAMLAFLAGEPLPGLQALQPHAARS